MEFQILDSDYIIDNGKPVVRLFGRDPDGRSVCCFVPDFEPYFYVQPVSIEDTLAEIPEIRRLETVSRYEPVGYQEHPEKMLKVVVGMPKDVRTIRDEVQEYADRTYETDIMFKNRFMIDAGIFGMGWARTVDEAGSAEPAYLRGVDSEVTVISQVSPAEIVRNAPMRYLAFDIECLVDGGIPTADRSPIIMISLAFEPAHQGELETLVLVGKEADLDCDGTEHFTDEADLLNRFFEVVRDYDPDVILGYNSNEFDFPYITKRVEVLEAQGKRLYANIGRDNRAVFCRKIGIVTHVSVTGRIVADVLPLVRRAYSIKQYTLKNVARTLLDIEKFDVSLQQMGEYWNDDGEKLAEFIEYARRDSVLAIRLLLDLKLLDKYVALSQVSGALMQDVLDGGQSSMVENLMFREFKKRDRVIPPRPEQDLTSKRHSDSEELKGGAVLEPARGLLKDVVVLDYKSLYPTIMMAHNLCYSTVVTGEGRTGPPEAEDKSEPVQDSDLIRSPSGGEFVPADVYKGIVPGILENLLDRRTETKKKMRSAGEEEHRVLDATQNALKILLNSFYGYSGYARARLYSLVLANAVTSFGRKNITDTKELIDESIGTIRLPGGKEFSLSVVYGDTDSVFVKIRPEHEGGGAGEGENGGVSLDDAESIGKTVAGMVSRELPDPMELEFESIVHRAIFIAKKRYALWAFEKTDDGWKDSIKVKGMETVRRDWCGLTSKTLNRVLELVLKEGRVDDAIDHVRGIVDRVRNLDVSRDWDLVEDLILTRRYTKKKESYKSKQPHITVVEKIRSRGGIVPAIGDRVPFVIIAGKGLFVDSAEDPEYVKEHNIALDVNYYIKKQILPPVERILSGFGVGHETLNYDSRQKGLHDFGIGVASAARVRKKKQVKKTAVQQALFDF
ncbi:MAG: DNA-directed DNA polymerase [Euryarchaeota archaeon]|nr:DNA-directed DNA polymerase [Euryarchaeota archaeon]